MSQENVEIVNGPASKLWNAGDIDCLVASCSIRTAILRNPEGWPEPGP